eukprot:CAMPEP_0114276136 /NCGR_PEP_ID=MMETSP0059-20121206/75_1 /TAXON_ID=36894 /ORGANISM="Pyramimonas parkeae, Strain CCMP726" /LENGTH=47 /DNA_ID= /DNA_START= /DNA_END= /DNA_ORIENTATION=
MAAFERWPASTACGLGTNYRGITMDADQIMSKCDAIGSRFKLKYSES